MRLTIRALLIAGPVLGSLVIARFVWDEPWATARVVMFSALVVAHPLYAFATGSGGRFADGTTASNRWLSAAVGLGIVLQILVVSVPAAHGVFGTTGLSLRGWLLVAVSGILPFLLMTSLGLRGLDVKGASEARAPRS